MPWAMKRSFQRIMVGSGGLQSLLDGTEGKPLAQHENEFGAENIPCREGARLRNRCEFVTLGIGKDQISGSSHTDIDASQLLTVTSRQMG